jgi:hypothetical protein
MALETVVELPFLPLYRQDHPNQEIVFDQVQLILPAQGSRPERTVSATPTLRFMPKASVRFRIPYAPDDFGFAFSFFHDSQDGTADIKCPEYGTTVEMFFSESNREWIELHPSASPVQLRAASNDIQYAIFHLLNWPPFHGRDGLILERSTTGGTSSESVGRVQFSIGEWDVTRGCFTTGLALTPALAA